MVVAALIGIWFYRTSKMNGLNAILWAVLGVASYFVGQVIAGVFIGIISPEMIDETMKLTLIGLVAGIVAVLITYWLMQMAASKKKNEKALIDDKLLDDSKDMRNSFESSNKIHDEI